MKKLLITTIFIGMATIQSLAQNLQTIAHNGTWVIEYNSKQPKLQTVKFYNDSAKLIHQEMVTTKLNISSKRIQNALNDICARLCEQDKLQNLRAAVAMEQLEKQ